ncbi:MAG: response regulator [Pseudomonadota bacterium]
MFEDINYKDYPILFVDDEPDALETIQWVLGKSFTVDSTDDPDKALAMLKEKEYAVILSDQRMPKMPGFELLAKAKEISPMTIRVVITGYADIEAAIAAVNKGEVYRYVPKKIPAIERDMLLKEAIKWHHTLKEMERLRSIVREYNEADVLEIHPEQSGSGHNAAIFFPDYDEEHFKLVERYACKLESIATRNLGKFIISKNPDPHLIQKLEGLKAHFIAYSNVGDKPKVRELLKDYYSDAEFAHVVLGKTLTASQIVETIKAKTPDAKDINSIASKLADATKTLYQIIIYSSKKIAVIQEQADGIHYRIDSRSHDEKIVVKKEKQIQGKNLLIKAEGDEVSAYDENGKRIGAPMEFFEQVIDEL